MSLVDDLRATGEAILEAERPLAAELPALVGALVLHLEQHVPALGQVDTSQLRGMVEPEPEPAGAAAPITSEPAPAAAAETPAELKARLEAELAHANAQAPAVSSEPAP